MTVSAFYAGNEAHPARRRDCQQVAPPWHAVLLILCGSSSVGADRHPLPDELQLRVNKAIDDGVKYLRVSQMPWGTWTKEKDKHAVGYAATPGLTLLECGVPAKIPARSVRLTWTTGRDARNARRCAWSNPHA